MQKTKTTEQIFSLLKEIIKEDGQPLAFHIAMATQDSKFENLTDKEFLQDLTEYKDALSWTPYEEEDFEDDEEEF